MYALASMRGQRIWTLIILALALSGCGKGDGPQGIAGTPATALPPVPPGFCDVINFEILCPPPSILNFNGGQTSIIDNPDASGLNTTEKVARMQKFPDDPALLFGGTRLDLAGPVNFANGEAFKVKVWSPRSVRMIFKLEEANNPNGGSGLELSHSGSGTWEELCYDFTGLTGGLPPIPALTVIFDNGVAGGADTNPGNWTFYYDEIEQVASCGSGGGGGGGSTTTLPFDFEGNAAGYNFGVDGGFEGGAASVIANPQSNGINTSAQVGQMLKFNGAVFGGSTLAVDTTTLAAGSSFTMKVWSQRAVPVQFQLEPYADPFFTSVVMHNGSGWEELTFEFPTFAGDISGITLIFDPSVSGAAETDAVNWTFYFDDITLVPPSGGGGGGGGGGGTGGEIAVNGGFETGDFTGWETFPGGGTQTIVTDNPSSGTFAANITVPVRGAGDSAVDNIIKNANLQAGNLTAGDTVTVSFDMRGSLSGAGGVVFAELFSELSGGGTSKAEILSGGPLTPTTNWSTYSYNTTLGDDVSGGVTLQLKASCGPVVGCGVDIFIDNVSIVTGSSGGGGGGGGTGAPALPIGFEAAPASYDFGVDGGFEGGASSVIANPQMNGINTSAQVGQMLKFAGQVFGGSTLAIETTSVAAGSSFTMKVWSQRAVPVLFQLEPYSDPFFGDEVTHTGSGWEELTFSFPTFAGDVSGITLIFDNGTAGAAATDATNWTFYFDDIALVPPGGGGGGGGGGDIAINGGFEAGDFSGWETLPGGGTQTIVTDNPSSGTFAANLTVPVRGAGDPPVDNLLKNANLEAGNLTPGDTVVVSFDMRGSLSGAGGVVFAELFSELSGGGTSKAEILSGGPLTPTTDWTNYSYTTTLGADVSGGVTLQLKASCGPVVGCGVDVFFDNISIVVGSGGGSGGGGGGGGTGSGFAAISFDDAGTTYTLTGFNGAEGSFVTNDPSGGTNMVVQVDRAATATLSAGTIVSTGANFSITELPLDAQNTQMTVRVYAPASGIPVRLKIENSADSNVSVETEATTTVANAWETLTFNFLNEVPGTTPFDPAATYDKVTIFFNFGTDGATAGAQTFYFDDIAVLPGTGGGGVGVELVVNGDFESGDLADWQVITMNGGSINLTTPGSGSSTGVTIDASGGPFNATLKQANLAAGQLTPGQEITVSLDWKGMAATGGVIDVVLFSEGSSGISKTDQILDGGAFPADWTTVGPRTLTVGPDVSSGLTLQITAICGAESACLSNVSLDNISIIAALSGGGGDTSEVLVTFDEATPPAVTVFGGAAATIGAAPAGGDGTDALQIARDGGQDFAGAYVIVPAISGAPGTQTISADVFSPTAGIPMPALIAIDGVSGTGNVQANEAVVVGWQTLTWTFDGLDTAADYVRFAMSPNLGTIDTTASYYFDNISLVGSGSGGGSGGGGAGPIGDGTGSCGGAGELATNCDFETGDLFGWTEFANGGLVEVVETGGTTSVYAAHLVAGSSQNPLIKQFEIASGVIVPGNTVTISFDMKGSLTGEGGVVFAEFFSEGDPTTGEILTGGPIFPTPNWTTYTYTPTAGADVTRGVTFQLAAVCGAVAGCGVDVYFDNVSIIIN